jgi:hypothetical protein
MGIRRREWQTARGEERVCWAADYFDQRGKRHQVQFKTKREAEAFLVKAKHEVAEGTHVPSRQGQPHLRSGILSKTEVLALRPPQEVGIYFLILGRTIQYIGQSVKVFDRVKNHKTVNKIPFDSWRFVPIDNVQDLDIEEHKYIRAHDPPYNVGIRRRETVPPASGILARQSVGHDEGGTRFRNLAQAKAAA